MFRKPKLQQVHDESPYETLSSTVNAAAKSKVPATSKKKGPPPLPPPRSATLPRHFHLQQFGGNDGDGSASPKRHSQISVDGRLLKAALRKSLSIDRESLPSSEPCQLSPFITKNSIFLPLRVGVCNGFCSSATDLSISQNEKFNLHFVKHTRVIVMRDSENREEYSVPLNSSVRFGIVYDPIQDEKRALEGFYFETVGALTRNIHHVDVHIVAPNDHCTHKDDRDPGNCPYKAPECPFARSQHLKQYKSHSFASGIASGPATHSPEHLGGLHLEQ